MNLYGYAGGDPINFHDPFGLSCEPRSAPSARLLDRCLQKYGRVTREEAAWARANPGLAAIAAQARLFGSAAGEEIAAMFGGDDAIENAARHIYGTCWMTYWYGESNAREVAEAHENNSPGSGADDTANDRSNNERGYAAGNAAKRDQASRSQADATCRSRTVGHIRAGDYAR
jgi:hypothetical protein